LKEASNVELFFVLVWWLCLPLLDVRVAVKEILRILNKID
jgi:hypothetical protein